MTVQAIYKLASALIGERPGEDPESQEFTPDFVNIALTECYEAEQQIRRVNGEAPLTGIPTVSGLTDEVAYDEKLCRTAIPYALAAHYYRDSGDNYHEQTFRALYINAVNEAVPYESGPIADIYG